MENRLLEQVLQAIDEGLQFGGESDDPIGEGTAGNIDAAAFVDFGDAVEREVVGEFADQEMCAEAGAEEGAIDQLIGEFGAADAEVGVLRMGVFGPDDQFLVERRGLEAELDGNFFADLGQWSAIWGDFLSLGQVDDDMDSCGCDARESWGLIRCCEEWQASDGYRSTHWTQHRRRLRSCSPSWHPQRRRGIRPTQTILPPF